MEQQTSAIYMVQTSKSMHIEHYISRTRLGEILANGVVEQVLLVLVQRALFRAPGGANGRRHEHNQERRRRPHGGSEHECFTP